jgi:non-ribosomal peptide synthase protein (TIGR01720 family)
MREDQRQEKRIVAYVVAEKQNASWEVMSGELRDHLRVSLPEYMVPRVWVELKELPRLGNGKLDRRALPAPERQVQSGSSYVAPQTAVEELLANIWAGVLRLERVGRDQNFFELGGDSILSIQVVSRANQAGLRLTPRQLFEHPTVAGLAQVAGTEAEIEAEQGVVQGVVGLTPIQRRFFERVEVKREHYNQAVFLELKQKPEGVRVRAAVRQLLAQHDALRLRFAEEGTGWRQWMEEWEDEGRVLKRVDLREVEGEQQLRQRLEEEAAQWQGSLNLGEGPVVRMVWFECGEGRADRLLWIIHHLAVDGVSWRILLEDLGVLWELGVEQMGRALAPKTSSYKQWAECLIRHGEEGLGVEEQEYWRRVVGRGWARLPVDYEEGENWNESAEHEVVSLGREETEALLQEVPSVYHTQINDVLLAALAETLGMWTGSRRVCIDLEGHGREDVFAGVDVSRTVGWFTTVYPVVLEVEEGEDEGERLKSVKEQLRGIPRQGMGYGVMRYVNGDEALRQAPAAEVCFNYLGQFDQVVSGDKAFSPAQESAGASRAAGNRRPYLLEINGGVSGGQLHLRWSYSVHQYEKATIAGVANQFIATLQGIIDHCRSPQAGGYTPSDFPLVELDQKTLDRLILTSQDMEKK